MQKLCIQMLGANKKKRKMKKREQRFINQAQKLAGSQPHKTQKIQGKICSGNVYILAIKMQWLKSRKNLKYVTAETLKAYEWSLKINYKEKNIWQQRLKIISQNEIKECSNRISSIWESQF